MFVSSLLKRLELLLLTLNASGKDSRPRYREAIVIKLQLLHQGNIILCNTENGVTFLDFLRVLCVLFVSQQIYQIWTNHLDFVVPLARGIPSFILLDFAFLMTEHIPDTQSFSIFVPGSFGLIGRTAGTPRKSL